MAIFRQVNAVHGEPRHHAILGIDGGSEHETIRARLMTKFGVHPVFYEIDPIGRPSSKST
jgi:hypothetical protein